MTHRWIDVGGLRLQCVEAGTGPLVVLLHGFPEFCYTWRHQIPALADAGYRVVAPDLPGYNTSDKPPRVRDYRPRLLVQEVADLIGALGADSATVAGHDWGGGLAWLLAMQHGERVERLVVLNAPHPIRFLKGLRSPRQLCPGGCSRPESWGCGSGVTCWRRLRDWQQPGVWEALHHRLLDWLGDDGQVDWSRAAIDSVSVRARRGGN